MKIPTKYIRIHKPFRLEDFYTDADSGVTGPKGAFAFIDRQDLAREAKKVYGRENDPNICLKVFFAKPLSGLDFFSHQYVETPLEEFVWAKPGEVTVIEATRMQNICFWQGNAPRIYGLVTLQFDDCTLLAQLTEDAGLMYVMEAEPKEIMQAAWDTIVGICNQWGYEVVFEEINDGAFWGGGKRAGGKAKWLDFQDFAPKRLPNGEGDGEYERKIVTLVLEQCHHFSVPLYQEIPQLRKYFDDLRSFLFDKYPNGVKGWRYCDIRFKDFGLDAYDFNGKTVLDIGCDNGMMLYECVKAGATRNVGVEPETRIESIKHVANYIGNWNADFYGLDLKGQNTASLRQHTGMDQFDVVLFLAMGNHVGKYPDYLSGMCKDLLIYERNNNDVPIEEVVNELLKLGFSYAVHAGETTEADRRQFVIARK